MKIRNIQQKICMGFFGVLLLAVLLYVFWEYFFSGLRKTDAEKWELQVSHDSGFYSESFRLEISGKRVAEIYYTMDGSQPEVNGEAYTYPEEGIGIYCDEEEQVQHIKYLAVYKDGSVSDVGSLTYITGENVADRYDMDVLTVWGDWEGLLGYENGIFVQGKLGDEYIASHPEYKDAFEINAIPVFGNRYLSGREAERAVTMTLFDSDGGVRLSQDCGVRIYGAMSRSKNQPSFRLYARSEYDEENTFAYPVFEDYYLEDGSIVSDFKRLIVRNGGNDNGYAYIRNELAMTICREAGFRDTQAVKPVCVYINGEYFGAYWLMSNYDDKYFENTYGKYDGEIFVYEGTINELDTSQEDEEPVYFELAEEYAEKQAFYAGADLNLAENWKGINEFMDVENFLQYMAILNYIGDGDSLYNNFRIYRYYAADGNYQENNVFDGRFRFLLFDLDYSLGLVQADGSGTSPVSHTMTDRLTWDTENTRLFGNLMTREDCREFYLRFSLSLMNYYFSEEHVMSLLQEMHAEREAELQRMYELGLPANNFLAPGESDYENVTASMGNIKWFVTDRPDVAMQDWQESLGELEYGSFHLTNETGAEITMDSIVFRDTELEGRFIKGLSVYLSVKPAKGWRMDHWVVNGTTIDEEAAEITGEMLQADDLEIVCVCRPDDEMGLEITAVKPKGGEDYIILTNFGKERVNIGAFFLSDEEDDPRKSSLPDVWLGAGESITIYCENCSDETALGKPAVGFNVKAGETITLSDRTGRLYSQVVIPDLGRKDSVYEMDPFTGEYREVMP